MQYFKFEQVEDHFSLEWHPERSIFFVCNAHTTTTMITGYSRSQEQACGIGVPGSQWMRGNQKDHIHDRGSRLSPSLE